MPSALENLKNADRELLLLSNALPNLDLSLDYSLRRFFHSKAQSARAMALHMSGLPAFSQPAPWHRAWQIALGHSRCLYAIIPLFSCFSNCEERIIFSGARRLPAFKRG